MPSLCSAAAAVISPMMSDTRCTLPTISCMVVPASSTRRLPSCTRDTLALIRSLISFAAWALRWARVRTSPATTAKPRPCSPARAASTAAFRARMLVWKAMPSITLMMSLMRWLLWVMSFMVCTTCPTTEPPRSATSAALDASWLAWRAASALCRTVAVSCSMLAAVSSRLLAVCSVRPLKSWLPIAISPAAWPMPSPACRIWPTTRCRLDCISARERSRVPNSSCRVTAMRRVRSPWAIVSANSPASRKGRVMERPKAMATATPNKRAATERPSTISTARSTSARACPENSSTKRCWSWTSSSCAAM